MLLPCPRAQGHVLAQPRIRILEEHTGVDLITLANYGGPEICAGAYVLDVPGEKVITILARATILAPGGAGKVYLYTTHPDVATGAGVAVRALARGAVVPEEAAGPGRVQRGAPSGAGLDGSFGA